MSEIFCAGTARMSPGSIAPGRSGPWGDHTTAEGKEAGCPPLARFLADCPLAAFRLFDQETASPSVIVKIPPGPARNGTVRRAASSMWIRGGEGGSFS
jgi:hypothetical protein